MAKRRHLTSLINLAKRVSVAMPLALSLTSAGCGASAPQASDDQVETTDDALINGTLATFNQFQSTLIYKMPGGGECTGVRVGPKQILTAAHCVTRANGTVEPSLASGAKIVASVIPVRDDTDTSQWLTAYVDSISVQPETVTQCALSPKCDTALDVSFLPPPDIAVITLKSNLSSGWATAKIDTKYVFLNDQVTMVGYGCEVGLNAPSSNIVRKKYSTVRTVGVDALNRPTVHVSAANTLTYASTYFVTPGAHYNNVDSGLASLCPGDSGGPVYRAGTENVVGINADYTFKSGDDVTWANTHTRVLDGRGPSERTLKWLRTVLPAASFAN